MNRRDVISAIGTGSVIGLGGCTSVFDDDTAVELLRVGVVNWTDEGTLVQVRVDLDGEPVKDVSYELGAEDGSRVLDCTWPAEPGNFVVSARLGDDDEWEERDVTDPDADCAAAHVMIDRTTHPPSIPISRDCEFYADRC